MPKISVIIPVHNTEKYLNKCLDSVLNQTLSDIEVICVDDCSMDSSLEILKNYAKQSSKLKIIELKKAKGVSAARNAGLNAACGDYIGFVDSDDFIDLDFYEKLYHTALNENADITKGNLQYENPENLKVLDKINNIDEVKINKIYFKNITTAIFLKDFILKNEISFCEDLSAAQSCLFEVKSSFLANKIARVEYTFYHYLLREQGVNNAKVYSKEKMKDLVSSFFKIVDYINSVEMDEKTYICVLNYRLNYTISLFYEKFDGSLSAVEEYEKIEKNLDLKAKNNLEINNINNLKILNRIFKTRLANKNSCQPKIPKRIFYVWFGGNKSNIANICIENWKDKLPDFEIIEINEKSEYFNFDYEYKNCAWFKDMCDKKLWAFAADYARCKVLYEYGGIYLDTDITLKKDLTPMLTNDFFIGEEAIGKLSAGIIGCIPKHQFIKDILDFYHNDIYSSPLYTFPDILTIYFYQRGYEDITIYDKHKFYPFGYKEVFTPDCIKDDTYAIHWWSASWVDPQVINYVKYKHLVNQL